MFGGKKKSTEEDTMSAIIAAARANGIIKEESVGMIPELQGAISDATKYFLSIAIETMTDAARRSAPQDGMAMMQRICMYMFAKGVEAVMLWKDSPDGNISIGFEANELPTLTISTDLDPERHKIAVDTAKYGNILFEAHNVFMGRILTSGQGKDEKWVNEEMGKAIQWSMMIGIAYATEKGYQQ